MPGEKTCLVCGHPQRDEIEESINMGESPVYLALKYGIPRVVIDRHMRGKCQDMPAGSVEQIQDLKERALKILTRAENEGTREACMALREVRSTIELLAKVQGEVDQGPQININLVENEWNRFQRAIIDDICPDCKRRLAARLEGKA